MMRGYTYLFVLLIFDKAAPRGIQEANFGGKAWSTKFRYAPIVNLES